LAGSEGNAESVQRGGGEMKIISPNYSEGGKGIKPPPLLGAKDSAVLFRLRKSSWGVNEVVGEGIGPS